LASKHNDTIRTGKNWWQLRKMRLKILKQQNFLCAECTEDFIKDQLGSELHHIDGNPRNNKRSNLTVLCAKCHSAQHPNVGVFNIGMCQICDRIVRIKHDGLCSRCYFEHFSSYKSTQHLGIKKD